MCTLPQTCEVHGGWRSRCGAYARQSAKQASLRVTGCCKGLGTELEDERGAYVGGSLRDSSAYWGLADLRQLLPTSITAAAAARFPSR